MTVLKGEVAVLKSDVATLKIEFAALKTDFKALKAEIASLEVRLVKEIILLCADTVRWIVTAIGINFLATAGLIIGLVKVFGK